MFRTVILAALVGAAIVSGHEPAAARSVKIVRNGMFAMETGLLVRAMSKELCSCWHVSRVGGGGPLLDGVAMCLERAQLPVTPGLIAALTDVEVAPDVTEFEVTPTFLGALAGLFRGGDALAVFDATEPRYGCTLAP